MKVYLDTNVWIDGGSRAECSLLKKLATDRHIVIYLNATAQHEQTARSSEAGKEFYEVLEKKDNWEERQSASAKLEDRRVSEEREREWWRPVIAEYPDSTFEGLLTSLMATMDVASLESMDVKGELPLLTELLDVFKIKRTDAMHLMSAHSAEMDYFLTRDGYLIKCARKVPWLKPVVETPTEFVKRF